MSNVRAEFYRVKEAVWIKIKIVGDPNEVERPVRDEDKARFPREWATFEAGQPASEPDGIPLTELEDITDQIAAAYRAKGVRTVEELAAIDDGALRGLGTGSLTNRTAARAYMAERQGAAIAAIVAEAPAKRRTKAA